MEHGFGSALQLDKPSAGKTGTSQENKAVWFTGYTPEVATSAVVAGVNDKGHPRSLNGVSIGGAIIGTAHGSTVAGPMWADAMRAIQDDIPYKDFTPPDPSPSQAGLPPVENMSVGSAQSAVRAAGFKPVLAGEVDSSVSLGLVAEASIGADGETVYLYTSTGHGGFAPAPTHHRGRGGGRGDHNPPGTGPGTGNGTAEGNGPPGHGNGHGNGHGPGGH
jgi:membrane peptidoglycan carboxypeptidase